MVLAIYRRSHDINIMTHSLIFILMAVICLAIFYGIRTYLGFRQIALDAREDYAYKVREDLFEYDVNEETYIRAYKRFHAPRGAAYICGAMLAILVLTAPAFIIIQNVLEQIWIWTGRSEVFHPGFLVWQFMIYFAVIAMWGGIIYLTAREFHRRAPLSFLKTLEQEQRQ